MLVTNIYEAKTHLSKLLDQVQHGEEVIIGKAGKPIAKLIPYTAKRKNRKPGSLKGKIKIAKDFDELPEEMLKAFGGES